MLSRSCFQVFGFRYLKSSSTLSKAAMVRSNSSSDNGTSVSGKYICPPSSWRDNIIDSEVRPDRNPRQSRRFAKSGFNPLVVDYFDIHKHRKWYSHVCQRYTSQSAYNSEGLCCFIHVSKRKEFIILIFNQQHTFHVNSNSVLMSLSMINI